jgi:hypothetical protein
MSSRETELGSGRSNPAENEALAIASWWEDIIGLKAMTTKKMLSKGVRYCKQYGV